MASIRNSFSPQMPLTVALLAAGVLHIGAMFIPLPTSPKKPKKLPVSVKVSTLPTPSPTPSAQPTPVTTSTPKVLVKPSPIVRQVIQRQIVLPTPTPIAPPKQQILDKRFQQIPPQPSPSPTPVSTPAPSPTPSPSATPSPTPTPPTKPQTAGGFILNEAGGEPCGQNCTQVPAGFTYQDFRQQVSAKAKGEVEEIRDEESESLLGWHFPNSQGNNEYWYRISLTGPNQQFIDRYYQLPQLYETKDALNLAIAQLASE